MDTLFETHLLTPQVIDPKAYYPSTLQPAECYGGRDKTSPLAGGALSGAISAAARYGIDVYLGTAMPKGEGHLTTGVPAANVTAEQACTGLADLHVAVLQDVMSTVPNASAVVKGLYIDVEEWNGPTWLADANKKNFAALFVERMASKAKAAFPGLLVYGSPYYVGNLTAHPTAKSAAEYAAYWADVFSMAPSLDAIALQDSRGYQVRHVPEVCPKASRHQGLTIFTTHGRCD